jgi:hypothetical protein
MGIFHDRGAFAFTVVATTMWASLALGEEISARKLAAHPEKYVGVEIEIPEAFCGSAAEGPGYVCSTRGGVYVSAQTLAANDGKRKIDEGCGGIDWIEKSPSCRVRLRFTPSGYRRSTQFEENKNVLVIDATEATAAF